VLEEGREYLAYDDGEELVAQARALLDDPARAGAIAAAGHRRYMAELAPDRQIARLLDWVGGGEIAPLYRGLDDLRVRGGPSAGRLLPRLRTYERVQEQHRRVERPVIGVAADAPPQMVFDLADLPRLTLRLAREMPDGAAIAAQARLFGARVELADNV
ncbi:MAG: glycosyltransferase, partial [Proteobacteria bacterium]|nr:glycosyltransferase [Pseudomonadota bacterium]